MSDTTQAEVPMRLLDGVLLPLTAAEIAERQAEEADAAARPPRWDVPKLRVVERLAAAGLLRTANLALRIDAPIADLTDAELALRERWNAAVVLANDDAQVIGFLAAIGADPVAILARP